MRISLTLTWPGLLATSASICQPWVDKPISCFLLVESRFRLHGIHREHTRYDYLVLALTKEAVSLVLDVVEHPPEHHPYSALKQSLLDSYQLTDYQKIATLHKMEPLCGRKPSELLASMLELCPRQNVPPRWKGKLPRRRLLQYPSGEPPPASV
jgi:hypothetical protein